jgi:endonuclease YncB( thermonuclease family)
VLEASVTYVPDGDSLVVLINGRKDRVRIVGVDAPEKGQPFANRSRDFTRSLCSGKTVTLSARGRDKYQRILAEASVDGINVGHELVKAGLAWSYDDGDTTVKAFESQARAARRGLWSQPHPVAPSQWRRARPSR